MVEQLSAVFVQCCNVEHCSWVVSGLRQGFSVFLFRVSPEHMGEGGYPA